LKKKLGGILKNKVSPPKFVDEKVYLGSIEVIIVNGEEVEYLKETTLV